MEILNNKWILTFIICFAIVYIIKRVMIAIIESIIRGRSITRSIKTIDKISRYIYWSLPLLFSIVLSFFWHLINVKIIDCLIYYAVMLLIFNSLFKTGFIEYIEKGLQNIIINLIKKFEVKK
jgi:hypothetical protein